MTSGVPADTHDYNDTALDTHHGEKTNNLVNDMTSHKQFDVASNPLTI
jgi:hypothetical protein